MDKASAGFVSARADHAVASRARKGHRTKGVSEARPLLRAQALRGSAVRRSRPSVVKQTRRQVSRTSGTDEARVHVGSSREGRSRSDASCVVLFPGASRPHGAARRKSAGVSRSADARRDCSAVTTVRGLRPVHSTRRHSARATSGATRPVATRQKAFRCRSSALFTEDGARYLVAPVNVGSRPRERSRAHQLLAASGRRRGVPGRRRETSEIGDVTSEGFPSRRGAGGPSREVPRGTGPSSPPGRGTSRSERESARLR